MVLNSYLLSYAEQRRAPQRAEREANRFAVRDAIVGAETGLNELRGYVRSLELLYVAAASTGRAPASMRVGFGRADPRFTRQGYERWQETEQGIIRSASVIGRHINELLRICATTDFVLPSGGAQRLTSAINGLNDLVFSMGDLQFGQLFAMIEARIEDLMDALRQIRDGIPEWRA
jgi:hypothetical protein